MRALIVVDYQNDFVDPAGALYVKDAEKIYPLIFEMMSNAPLVVLTKDWHQPDDPSFKANGGMWPVHCQAGTWGSRTYQIVRNHSRRDLVLYKQGYSAFRMPDGSPTGLHGYLRDAWVDELDICGVALDFCVKETALDAARLGYGTRVRLSATKAVNPGVTEDVVAELRREGIAVNP